MTAEQGPQGQIDPLLPNHERTGRPIRVVIADDRADVREGYKAISSLVFGPQDSVHMFSNGSDVWNLIQEHAGEVDLLWTDKNMTGILGVDLIKMVRVHAPHIVTALVTTEGRSYQEKSHEELVTMGIDMVVAKGTDSTLEAFEQAKAKVLQRRAKNEQFRS